MVEEVSDYFTAGKLLNEVPEENKNADKIINIKFFPDRLNS